MSEVRLDRDFFRKMEEIGKKTYPAEGCAVLIGDLENFTIKEVKEIKNLADKEFSNLFFRINPKEILSLENELEGKGEIIGFFHTHPDCRAIISKEDEEYMIPGLLYVVMSIVGGSFADLRAYVKDSDCEGIEEYGI